VIQREAIVITGASRARGVRRLVMRLFRFHMEA